MGFYSFITQDLRYNANNSKGKIIALLFRIANSSIYYRHLNLFLFPYRILYKLFVEWGLGIEIPFNTKIGKGIQIFHGQGLVINSKTIIGNNVCLRQNTTIGNSVSNGICPKIEDNVTIGANCVIIGNVTIGHDSIIGAGSVVVKNVPPYAVVVGNPGKVIKFINN